MQIQSKLNLTVLGLIVIAIGFIVMLPYLQLIYSLFFLILGVGLVGWLVFGGIEKSVKIIILERESRMIDAKKSAYLTTRGEIKSLPIGPYGYGVPNVLRGSYYDPAPAPVVTAEPEPELKALPPGTINFSEVLNQITPSSAGLVLAVGPGGAPITTPAHLLFHIALTGMTRNGKSNILRLIGAQLLFCGALVYWLDPHWTDFDPETGEDWRPIKAKLAEAPRYDFDDIAEFLKWAATKELTRRMENRRNQISNGKPLFIIIDEVPGIVARRQDCIDWISLILREGAKHGIFLVLAAQDFLIKTLKADNGVRSQLGTVFYLGGDLYSAAELLRLTQRDLRENEGQLGRGIAMLKCASLAGPEMVRVPLADNAALYRLLGQAQSAPEPEPEPDDSGVVAGKFRVLAGGANKEQTTTKASETYEVKQTVTDEDIFEEMYKQPEVTGLRDAQRRLQRLFGERWNYTFCQRLYTKLVALGKIEPKKAGPGRKASQ